MWKTREMDQVARARALSRQGNNGAAVALLKARVERERTPGEARRALAEIYREMGAPDQAGRWGIAFDGWTTSFERDRLARALAFYADPWVFLSLPSTESASVDLAEVLAKRKAYSDRAAARNRRAIEGSRETPDGRAYRREEALWATAFVLGVIAPLGPLLVVFGSLLLNKEPLAAWASAAGWSVAAVASFLIVLDRCIGARRFRLGWAFWATLVLAAVAAGHCVVAVRWTTL